MKSPVSRYLSKQSRQKEACKKNFETRPCNREKGTNSLMPLKQFPMFFLAKFYKQPQRFNMVNKTSS